MTAAKRDRPPGVWVPLDQHGLTGARADLMFFMAAYEQSTREISHPLMPVLVGVARIGDQVRTRLVAVPGDPVTALAELAGALADPAVVRQWDWPPQTQWIGSFLAVSHPDVSGGCEVTGVVGDEFLFVSREPGAGPRFTRWPVANVTWTGGDNPLRSLFLIDRRTRVTTGHGPWPYRWPYLVFVFTWPILMHAVDWLLDWVCGTSIADLVLYTVTMVVMAGWAVGQGVAIVVAGVRKANE